MLVSEGLQIQPVGQFENDASVFHTKILRAIVVRVYYEQIRHRQIPPLKATVDIQVFRLGVVLDESGPEHRVAEIDFHGGA